MPDPPHTENRKTCKTRKTCKNCKTRKTRPAPGIGHTGGMRVTCPPGPWAPTIVKLRREL
ncbi:hypothetical protein DY245_00440 [Streptomyces inhibens]|uniref:Uncharacterized protein n=1 Tax=Streptomyces inhibens TaxID=2293571 RepID=A0A371QBX1_STRIH|nr:hypothetical protein [Streptomyces inhibens]REK92157.1 hypothetical protein DY245_00440 [Streptomyces inhibens]